MRRTACSIRFGTAIAPGAPPRRWMPARTVPAIRGCTLIVNFPGSPRAIGEAGAAIAVALPHAIEIMRGGGH